MKVKKANLVKLMVKIATAVVVFFIKNKLQCYSYNALFCHSKGKAIN